MHIVSISNCEYEHSNAVLLMHDVFNQLLVRCAGKIVSLYLTGPGWLTNKSFFPEPRPLRTQSVSMWNWLQNNGKRSMKEKKRETRPYVTPYSGLKMSSTDGAMVRSLFVAFVMQKRDLKFFFNFFFKSNVSKNCILFPKVLGVLYLVVGA